MHTKLEKYLGAVILGVMLGFVLVSCSKAMAKDVYLHRGHIVDDGRWIYISTFDGRGYYDDESANWHNCLYVAFHMNTSKRENVPWRCFDRNMER